VSVRPGKNGTGETVLVLNDGVTSSHILNVLTDETWTAYLPIKSWWGWRRIAFDLATRLHIEQLDYRKKTGNRVNRIDGHNGTAIVKVYMRVKVPPQYGEAQRQRFILGLESAASLTNRDPIQLERIAMGAVTGHGLRSRERLSFFYPVTSMQYIWRTEKQYVFADDDVDAVLLKVQRAIHLTGAETQTDRANDSVEEWKQRQQEDRRAQREEAAELAADKKREEREARRKYNREQHRKKREEQASNAKQEPEVPHAPAADPFDEPWR